MKYYPPQELIDQQIDLGKMMLDAAQKTTPNLVDFYNLVDRNGTTTWSSSMVDDIGNTKFKEFATALDLTLKGPKIFNPLSTVIQLI